MSRSFKGCTVAFDRDVREDDVEEIIRAIRMIKGVGGVTTTEAELDDWNARVHVRCELAGELGKVINKTLYPERKQP